MGSMDEKFAAKNILDGFGRIQLKRPDVPTAGNCRAWGGGRLFKHPLPSKLKAVAGSFMLSLGLYLFVLLLLIYHEIVRSIMTQNLTPLQYSVVCLKNAYLRLLLIK